jgi:hypothetical protein
MEAEYHIVIRRPLRRGPFARYRFALAVLAALAILVGRSESIGASLGVSDGQLLRALGGGLFTWFVVGFVDRTIARASSTAPE